MNRRYDAPVELRELRYFVAVAEELHFGRAADRLAIAQPPLSRAIQLLERRLGVSLLHRSTRPISLTRAGQVLLDEARATLEAAEAASRRTRRAAAASSGVVLAAKAGAASEFLSRLLVAYAAVPGAADVEVTLCGPGEQAGLLRDGRADVALLQRPYDATAGFDIEELNTEAQILVVAAGHPLAGRAHVSVADINALIDLPQPRWPEPDGSCHDGAGPLVRDRTQLFQLIALGRTYALMPESARAGLSDAHAIVPVTDAPAVTTVIAWPPHSRSQTVADLVRTAARLATPRTTKAASVSTTETASRSS